jgi:hypothetical protein
MARTLGHTVRRYEGHKLYLATIATRKAIMLADDGADPSDVPFWADAPEPEIEDLCDVGEIAYQEDLADMREHERALLASAMRCTCTEQMRAGWECCAWCELSGIYSDVYKERNGIRPRHHGEWSAIDLDREIRWMYANPVEPEIIEPTIPTSGQGWTLITDEPEGADVRLENDWYRG